jgi:gliding motility-associated-like protein
VKDGLNEGCGEISDEVSIIGFPQYFSPNGDGINDFWNIDGAKLQPNSKIYIYNRYGKIIVKTIPESKGWDGTLNGIPLPVTDYWFKAKLEDGREITGHFSLVR